MLFTVLVWISSIVMAICGKNLPLEFSDKNQIGKAQIHVIVKRKSGQGNELSINKLNNKVENKFQLYNSFHSKNKDLGPTFVSKLPAPLSSASSLSSTSSSAPPLPQSPRTSSQPPQLSSLSPPLPKSLLSSSAASQSSTSSPPPPQPSSSSSTTTTTKTIFQSADKQKTDDAKRVPVFRKRKAASQPPSTISSTVTTSSTSKSTTTVKPVVKRTMNPTCVILKKLKAKLPPDCMNTQNIMNPWS